MATIESPTSPAIILAVDPTYQALRASLYPREFNKTPSGPPLGGHYRMAAVTGLTTVIAAAGGIFSVRWTDTSLRFILQRLQISAVITTAFGTAQEISVDLAKLINYSVADSGGTSMLPIGTQYKKKTTMADSVINDARVSTTAALTNGTATAQAAMSSTIMPFILNAVGSSAGGVLYDTRPGEEAPLEIAQNEGFRVRLAFTMGATGVVRWQLIMDWAEVPNIA